MEFAEGHVFSLCSLALGADLLVGPGQTFTTVHDALAAAADGDRLLVDPGDYASEEVQITARSVSIEAVGGPGTARITAASGARWVRLVNAELSLVDLDVDGLGARRLIEASNSVVTATRTRFTGGSSPADGGAIDAQNSTVTLEDAEFVGNAAAGAGGHVAARGGSLSVEGGLFSAGSAANGGALSAAQGATLSVSGASFDGNAATGEGGAIRVDGGGAVVLGASFAGHTANLGTFTCAANAGCSVFASTFRGNQAARGAVLRFAGAATHQAFGVTACENSGSALVEVVSGSLEVGRLFLLNNEVGTGGISVAAGASAGVWQSHLIGNQATGGAAALEARGDVVLGNTLIGWNSGPGGAVTAPTGGVVGLWNVYWQNSAAGSDLPLDATERVLDPQLSAIPGPGCDLEGLRPFADSPLIDGGHPEVLDPDGTRSDVGAFHGQPGVPRIDDDGDGSPVPYDCDDANPLVSPLLDEIPCNGVDDDCDPTTPDDRDEDVDGVSVCGGDCDDTDPASFPGAVEVPYDGVDQDCDGADLVDVDGDGVPWPDDCDDEDAERFPGGFEIPDDGIDQNCSGDDATAGLTGRAGLRCACASGAPPNAWAALLLGALVARRRR